MYSVLMKTLKCTYFLRMHQELLYEFLHYPHAHPKNFNWSPLLLPVSTTALDCFTSGIYYTFKPQSQLFLCKLDVMKRDVQFNPVLLELITNTVLHIKLYFIIVVVERTFSNPQVSRDSAFLADEENSLYVLIIKESNDMDLKVVAAEPVRRYVERPNRFHPTPRRFVYVIQRARDTVQIQEHRGQHAGRARRLHMLQTKEEVLDIVEDDPSTSTREIARQI
ncbi:hypothetical protein NQ317_002200 [Molorchus minor]|uniref:Uncharacterized protein n=1 Tax=Molorchus minor TaxID=1323400 RepID=A0ABQ9JMG9_9CUCU|nr:hypothetical protein NQ317_002200 [Molorchus minor]